MALSQLLLGTKFCRIRYLAAGVVVILLTYPLIFQPIFSHFVCFINIHEYAN